MLSIKEVAKLTGLSTATISRALDPRYADKVRPETRKKILAVCDSGNYRPGFAGRSFVTGKSYKIGFISADPAGDFGNLFQGFFFQEAGVELQKAGYTLLLLCASDNEEKSDVIVNFLRSGVADAYIIGNTLTKGVVGQAIAECQVPVLRLSRYFSGGSNYMSIRKDLSFAYREIWGRIPLELRKYTVFCGRHAQEEKYRVAAELAPENTILPFAEIPTGLNFAEVRNHAYLSARQNMEKLQNYKIFWCSSDLMALGVKDALEEQGRGMGKDFYLIGYDNIEALPSFSGTPFLSTITGAWEEEGRTAARMILDALAGKTCAGEYAIKLQYISRESFPF